MQKIYALFERHARQGILWFFLLCMGNLFAQAPNISYSSPQEYLSGTAISSLTPTNSGGAVPASTYRNVSTVSSTVFNDIKGVTRDALGNTYVAEHTDGRIRKIAANGTVSTLVDWSSFQPNGISINTNTGDLYISISTHRILKVANSNSANYPSQDPTYTNWTDAAIIWLGSSSSGNTDASGTSARFNTPTGIYVDATNTFLYVADYANNSIRKVTISTGAVATVSATPALTNPEDVVVDGSGILFVTQGGNDRIIKIDNGTATNFVGSGTAGYLDATGTNARLNDPRGIDIDNLGNLYIADGASHSIRRVTPAGVVTTVAGSGTGMAGAYLDGVGTSARFNLPWDVYVERSTGAVYVGEWESGYVRKIDLSGYTVWPALPEGLSLSATTGVISGTPTTRSRQVYYADDFNDGAGGTGASIAGHAAYVNNWMRLTDAVNTQDGAFKVDASGLNTNGLQLDFTMILGKTSGAADGLSYSFAADAVTTGGSWVQLGTGTGLSLSFVNYSSNTVKMNLYYGSGRTNTTTVSGSLLASNTSNNALWLGRTSRISLSIDEEGKVTVKVDGTTVFNQVQLPADYLSANKSTWFHVFRAITGGANDVHAIDDLVIRQNPGAADHTVTAYNASGSATATVNINVTSPPTLSTAAVISVASRGASSGGTITANGGSSITARGVVWSTSPNPTVALSTKTSDGTGTGSFSSTISGLTPGTTYYLRAYATNANSTGYGSEVTFTTLQEAPSISYAVNTHTLIAGTAATPILLTITGGQPDINQVSTLAGKMSFPGTLVGGIGSQARFNYPQGLALDANGNLLVADSWNNSIRKIVLSTGEVTTLAGDGTPGNTNGTGTAARFSNPTGLAVASDGMIYVADYSNSLIRRITPTGIVTTFAGTGAQTSTNGSAISATFTTPFGIAINSSGEFYITDANLVRKIDASLNVTTLAGSGAPGTADATGVNATFWYPQGIKLDAAGNLYVADKPNHRIRRITPAGVVSTFAGAVGGANGFGAGYINATGNSARFWGPAGLAIDVNNNVYVADGDNYRIRKITSAGVVTTFAGPVADLGISSRGSTNSTLGNARFNRPLDVAIDTDGNIYMAENVNVIRIISKYRIDPELPEGLFFDARNGTISGTPVAAQAARVYTIFAENAIAATTTQITIGIAAAPTVTTGAASSITATTATLNGTVNANGSTTTSLSIRYSLNADLSGGQTATVSPTSATGSTNTSISADITGLAPATSYFYRISATNTAGTSDGTILSFTTGPVPPSISYSASSMTFSVGTPVSAAPTVTGGQPEPMQVVTFAGSTAGNFNGTGVTAKFNEPISIVADGNGNLFVTELTNHQVRKIVISTGEVSTFAGSLPSGSADGTGTSARFFYPYGITIDPTGNLYVVDRSHRVRKISSSAVVTSLAGEINVNGSTDGTGTAARFNIPYSMAFDASSNNLYVAEMSNRIRMVTPAGVVTSPLGSTFPGYGSGGSGTAPLFYIPRAMTFGSDGSLYVADWNSSIRKSTIPGYMVTTFAGSSGITGTADGTGTDARFKNPQGLAADGAGNIYVADTDNNLIRKINASGNVITLAGEVIRPVSISGCSACATPQTTSYADGTGSAARFDKPIGITLDASGNIYVADMRNHRIRRISKYSISPALPAGLSFNTATGEITGTPTALSAARTYTIKASNTGGTATATVTIDVSSALLTTDASAITETTASSGGTVDASFTGVTARGVVWNTSVNPDITLSTKTSDGTGTGTFTSSITGLLANTTYYVRAYVVHSGGTDYGAQKTFKTNQLGTFADITKTFGDANFSLTAPTAVSTGAFSYTSSNTSVATISGSTVTITGVGTSTITATQAVAGAYVSLAKTLTLTVNKATPSITLNIPSTTTLAAANNMSITATASNGEEVTIAIGSGTATGILNRVSAGSYTLNSVSQTGNIVFNATTAATATHEAASKTVTMDVTKLNQSILFSALSDLTYSNGLTRTLVATPSGVGLSATLTVVSGPGSLSGNILTITGPGSIVIRASQPGDINYNPAPDVERTQVVNPGAPVVSSFTPASAREGDVVTITGQYFDNVNAVSFGGTAATSFIVVNSTTITAVVGTGATGSVSVSTTGGTHSKAGFRYKVLWTGATNAFNQSANWSGNRVPQTDDDIVFDPNAASDLELDGSKTVGNVDFNGSGRSLNLGAHNLIVRGNITMPGEVFGTGRVILRGSSAQSIIGGGTIPELEIDNSAGVSIDASGNELKVAGRLHSTSGSFTTNGKLRLLSNVNATARVGVVSGTITGNVIAERYVQRNNNTDGTGRAWRLVSIPVSGLGTLRDFFMNGRNGQDLTNATAVSGESDNAGTPIVGHGYATAAAATAAGFDWIGVANMVSSLRYYSGDAGGGAFNSDQVPDLTTTYENAAQGYMVFTRGDRKLNFPDANSSSATTFRSTGELKTGDQQVSVAPASTSKYTLVGNPYMSVLDLDAFYTTNSAVINPSFWIWEPNIAGSFRQGEYINVYKSGTEWVTNTGTYINPQLIESGVAFFVEPVSSLATATNITIQESHKSSEASAGLAPLSTEPKDERGRLFVKLQRADARGERQLIDGVAMEFHKDLKETLGDAIDHEKLRNGISRGSLWVINSGKSLSSEGRPWPALDSRKSIPLRMSNIGDQTLIVAIDPRGMNKPGLKAWLKDNSLRTEQEIDLSRVNEFDFIGTGSAAKDSTRFEIVYAQQPLPPVTFIHTSAKKVASGVEIKWETPLDAGASYEIIRSADLESFTTIHKQAANGKSSNSYSFTDTKPHPVVNYYRVVSKNATGQLWMSNWMRVNMSMKAGDWKLYPNPSAETKLQLELAEVNAGTYTVTVFDQQGRQVDQQRMEHGGGNRVHGLILPKRLTTGIYILQVTNARGEIEQTMKWMRE